MYFERKYIKSVLEKKNIKTVLEKKNIKTVLEKTKLFQLASPVQMVSLLSNGNAYIRANLRVCISGRAAHPGEQQPSDGDNPALASRIGGMSVSALSRLNV